MNIQQTVAQIMARRLGHTETVQALGEAAASLPDFLALAREYDRVRVERARADFAARLKAGKLHGSIGRV